MKLAPIALAAAMIAAPAAADSTAWNSAPTDGWIFGSGNNYSPSNTAVLSIDGGDEMYLRFHRTFDPAPASSAWKYSFALGTDPLSFDWGIDNNQGAPITALLTLSNLGTGQSVSYDPFAPGNDNESANGSSQNSFRFNWIPGLFDPNVDGTYRVDLMTSGLGGGGDRELSIIAQFGAGAPGVPEPTTWALLILGFGLVGGAMRRKTTVAVSYA